MIRHLNALHHSIFPPQLTSDVEQVLTAIKEAQQRTNERTKFYGLREVDTIILPAHIHEVMGYPSKVLGLRVAVDLQHVEPNNEGISHANIYALNARQSEVVSHDSGFMKWGDFVTLYGKENGIQWASRWGRVIAE